MFNPKGIFFLYFLLQLYCWVIILYINCGHQGTAINMQRAKPLSNARSYFTFTFTFEIRHHTDSILQSSSTIHFTRLDVCMCGAQYLQIICHCPISHLSLLCVVSELSCTVTACLQAAYVPLVQRCLIPVLTYPRSAHFVRLYHSTVSSLRSGHHITGYSAMILVRSEHICSIQSALKYEIFVLIYRGILCQTSCFSSKFRLCVKTLQAAVQHKSVNECSEVK